jgi:hypothetical protein
MFVQSAHDGAMNGRPFHECNIETGGTGETVFAPGILRLCVLRRRITPSLATAVVLFTLPSVATADDGQIRLSVSGTDTIIQVRGSKENDWRIQTSRDLMTWSNVTAFGPLLSGGADAPSRSGGGHSATQGFFRAVKTDGLFDPTLLRTISLTFAQTNWQSLLTNSHLTGSNVLASMLVLDNGATNFGVGVRYKGNTSYFLAAEKKSLNIDLNYTNPAARLMGYETVNLNNAAGDETMMREPLYFNVMRNYAVCPKASLVKLLINGAYWGVYSFVQQEDDDLIKEWFPSNDGDRWQAPNVGTGPGGFASSNSALSYLGTNVATYMANYGLKKQNSVDPWTNLIHAIDVLNNAPTNQLRDSLEDVLAVDRWLWFLAIENIFVDDDSYFNKGADYGFYFEPESGRIHPVEHDGNEAFFTPEVSLSPIQGDVAPNRPLLNRLLGVAELRQRYLAHMRTVLWEFFNPTVLSPLIDRYSALSVADIMADTKKDFSMGSYTNGLNTLRSFVKTRSSFLATDIELRLVPPTIGVVNAPAPPPTAGQTPFVTARVLANGTDGLSSVWLYHRSRHYGRFTAAQMFDDGAHGDGAAGDGVFGAATTNHPAGTKVRFYVEARSGNAAKTAAFSPARAEQETYTYRVALATATNTPVVISEFMASNTTTLADPQGDFDDWIELHNLTNSEVDLTGRYLSDEPGNPRKWQFPPGTRIAPDGYLLIWADEDGSATVGLHASFKLAASGEQIFLTDTDANFNAVLDSITFGPQATDRSYGRSAADADVWTAMNPTPGAANQ